MNENLQKAGNMLASKIQWLLDNGKISAKQIDDYNKIIDLIEKGSNENEKDINQLMQNNMNFSLIKFNLQQNILRLEAICLYHGIININYYLNKPGLINDAKQAMKNNSYQLPYVFMQNKTNLLAVNQIIKHHYNSL